MISCRCSMYVLSSLRNRLSLGWYRTCSRSESSLKNTLNTVNNLECDQSASKYKWSTNNEYASSELSSLVQEKSSNWTDEFGSLVDRKINLTEGEEQEDEKPYVRLSKINRRHKPDYYANKITRLGKNNMIYEAIEVLETEMLVTDRVMPNEFVFTALIGVLGRVGYTEKAFKLFNKMKKFGIIPTSYTYTSLFNCCSNSPDKKEGLEKVNKLKDLMKEKDIEMNQITFQAMLKAYARLGDVAAAFTCMDEAVQLRMKLDENIYSFLLMACISDKQNGFNLALRVWLLILKSKTNVNLFHINLILKAARFCDMGTVEQIDELFKSITDEMISKIKIKLQNKNILFFNDCEQYSMKDMLHIQQNFDKVNKNPIEITGAIDLKSTILKKLNDTTIENKGISINEDAKKNDQNYTSLDFTNLQMIHKKSKAKISKETLINKEYNISEMLNESLRNISDGKNSIKVSSESSRINASTGSAVSTNNTPLELSTNNMLFESSTKNLPLEPYTYIMPLESPTNNTPLAIETTTSAINSQFGLSINNTPQEASINLLLPTNTPNVMSIKLPLRVSDKLMLMGGLKGCISTMHTLKVEPDLKTVSLLLDLLSIDGTVGVEEEHILLSYIEKKKIRLDITFYNLLIKKRNLRKDFGDAKEVLSLMSQNSIEPNIRTFGCLAMGCTKKPDALLLIADMRKLNMTPNVEICEILLSRSRQDFDYKLVILKKMQELHIRPSSTFLVKLDEQVTEARKIITRIEQSKEVKPMYLSGKFQDGYRRFILNYKSWLQQMQLEPRVHPWDPYKQPTLKDDHSRVHN